MSNLLVVNYPTITSDDLAWIQEIRQKYDELNFRAIDPHFTLVFPIIDLEPAALIDHVNSSIVGIRLFELAIRCVV